MPLQMKKIFNPALVAETFLDRHNTPLSWETKAEARRYARFLAEGLTFWSTIDIIVALALSLASLFVSIPAVVLAFVVAAAIGFPLIMTLGVGVGCLEQLTFKETWHIIRDYFLE